MWCKNCLPLGAGPKRSARVTNFSYKDIFLMTAALMSLVRISYSRVVVMRYKVKDTLNVAACSGHDPMFSWYSYDCLRFDSCKHHPRGICNIKIS